MSDKTDGVLTFVKSGSSPSTERETPSQERWTPGNRVDQFVSHDSQDADEFFIFAVETVFPKEVGKVFPGIRHARFGYVTTDDMFELPGNPNTIYVGVGKAKTSDSFDEHGSEKGLAECAASRMIKLLELDRFQQEALINPLAMILFEEKNGTDRKVQFEIPGVVKYLHAEKSIPAEKVRDWCVLAYAAKIKEDYEKAQAGTWVLEKHQGWQLNVERAEVLIQKWYPEQLVWWKGVFESARNHHSQLKKEAEKEIRAVKTGQTLGNGSKKEIVFLSDTVVGRIRVLLAVDVDNRTFGERALVACSFAIAVVKNKNGTTQVMMNRRLPWCACHVAAELRKAENRKRGLSAPSHTELFKTDSSSCCPQWHRFAEAPYVSNGTLKHSAVDVSLLTMYEVMECVERGVKPSRCVNWPEHHWFDREDQITLCEKPDKRREVDDTLEEMFQLAFAEVEKKKKK